MTQQTGSCHCGNVKFEVDVALDQAISCNCSMCHRKGALLAFVPATKFKLLAGEKNLTDHSGT